MFKKVTSDSINTSFCTSCGSTEYLENYPVEGKQICLECGKEITEIKLTVVLESRSESDCCPFCEKEREITEFLLETEGIMVYKCKNCEKLTGYKPPDLPDLFDYGSDSLSEKIAKQEGKFVYSPSKSKELKRALRKNEKAPIELCKRQLNALIREKLGQMNAAGISIETINSARRKVIDYLEKPLSHKQLTILLAAAIYEASREELIGFGGVKPVGEQVSERLLEKIFGVTRKTIRKWRKSLPRRIKKFYL